MIEPEPDGTPSANEAAKALSALGASKGGKERAKRLTPERRREIAVRAIEARWNRTLPKATHEGPLSLGDRLVIPAAVLDTKVRVLSQRQFSEALGSPRGGRAYQRRLEVGGAVLPVFLAYENLIPFVDKDLIVALAPIEYRPLRGGRSAFGQEATVIPKVCDVWLRARAAGVLSKAQLRIAAQAELIVRGLANVGIIALVDEATGYRKVAERDELQQILKAYVAPEFLPYTRRFPEDFYREMFRLRGWQFDQMSPARGPRYAGKLTNEIVFEKLPPGVLVELRRRNPVTERGRRDHKHHTLLTPNVGVPHLERHLAVVTALMRLANSWEGFERLLERAIPTPGRGVQEVLFQGLDDELPA